MMTVYESSIRFNNDEAVRFLQGAGNLGDELVGGHAD
jgi:hypothetical protein